MKYAWNESEIGAGLEPGKGTATPAMAAVDDRLLQLAILPYGFVKAALAAGSEAKVSKENGATVITTLLQGELAGITAKVTLDEKNRVTKVETRTDDPVLGDIVTEADYSEYADLGMIATDVQLPGHIVQKQGGFPVLDIRVNKADLDNPYLVFPVPDNVMKAAADGRTPRQGRYGQGGGRRLLLDGRDASQRGCGVQQLCRTRRMSAERQSLARGGGRG